MINKQNHEARNQDLQIRDFQMPIDTMLVDHFTAILMQRVEAISAVRAVRSSIKVELHIKAKVHIEVDGHIKVALLSRAQEFSLIRMHQ